MTVDNKALLHDLRNQVQSLMIPLESLRKAINNGGQQFRPRMNAAVDLLEDVQRKLETEITNIKDAAGRNSRSPCSLNEVIDDIRDELKKELAEHAIELNVKVPQETIAHARYGVIRSALKNILVNAKQALQYDPGANKEIRITVGTAAGRLICDISDNGPGVSEEVKPTLLNAVSKSTKPESNGVGLLLSRIAMLVSGGDIILLEQGEERGATFRIKFPKQKSSTNGNGAKAVS